MTSSDHLPLKVPGIRVRLAKTAEEILAAQRLRYQVFYEECGAIATPQMIAEGREFDEYDAITDHLIVVDETRPESQIVGTYRLLRSAKLPPGMPFYTSHEFDISSLIRSGGNLLELGRSCVMPEYRTRPVLQLLWQGITAYFNNFKVDLLFGTACLPGTNVDDVAEQLSYMYHFHRAPDELCPVVLPKFGVATNIIPREIIEPKARRIFSDLPPLIKGYLRVGCHIGNGAFVDHQFNSIDVCIVLPTESMAEKYLKHYNRKNNQSAVDAYDFSVPHQPEASAT